VYPRRDQGSVTQSRLREITMNWLRLKASAEASIDRRTFLKAVTTAGAGLTIGIFSSEDVAQTSGPGKTTGPARATEFVPNAFLRIKPDNTVTVLVKHVEMGQGTYTGLPTLVAEELDAAWAQVRVEGAPADEKLYNNLLWGPVQGTGGSTAMANSFDQYRQAGAAARAMLISAAAQKWNVAPESINVKSGTITHASGKKATFGELADAAAKVAVPQNVKTKDAKDYIYIGKSFARPDSKAKSTGTATFTQDIKLPDMLTAVVAHPPKFGATVKSFKAESVQGIPGVRCVVELSADRCDVWNGEQFQTVDQGSVAKTVGLSPQQVFLHQLFAGGSFGRRANPQSDYLVEAASIAKSLAAMGKGAAPIKLVW